MVYQVSKILNKILGPVKKKNKKNGNTEDDITKNYMHARKILRAPSVRGLLTSLVTFYESVQLD